MPYQLRDIVAEVLADRMPSWSSIEMFNAAFGFTEDEVGRLSRLWNGASNIRIVAGNRAMPAQTEHELVQALGPRRHQTLSLHDHVYVGSDGRIERSHIMQVIEAIVEDVDRIPFLADTNVLTIEAGQGCKELAEDVSHLGNGVFATDILLARTLRLGETITLEYWCTYRHMGNFDDEHELEWRRGVLRQITSYDIRIQFDASRLPSGLWWATWDDLSGEAIDEQEVTLDSQNSVHRYLQWLEKTVVGFRWVWDN
jgi:hypothetical protein